MTIELTVDTRQWEALAKRIGTASADGTVPLGRLDVYKKTRIGQEWQRARAESGGVVMGQKWDPMVAQYTRKDGTVVPAWGGVAKVHGRGKVKGRKRPSGTRVKPTSVIGMDTQLLYKSIVAAPKRIRKRGTLLDIGHAAVHTVEYGTTIMGYDNRNPLRWELPRDLKAYEKIVATWYHELIREHKGRVA